MSKLLIALLALDIGVSLSKVLIFTWKSNYLAQKKQLFSKKRIIYWVFFIYVFSLFFFFFAIYEWLSIEIHVYHDAAPELAQVPVLWPESYCGLSDGRSDDFVVFTTIYL